jgi:hypothetical protein
LLEGRGGAWRVSTFDSEYKLPWTYLRDWILTLRNKQHKSKRRKSSDTSHSPKLIDSKTRRPPLGQLLGRNRSVCPINVQAIWHSYTQPALAALSGA